MKDRTRIEIISQILKTANGGRDGAKKIRIMYGANLSHEQLKQYLMFLTQNNLLGYDLDTRTFKITEKGLRFLDTYDRIDPTIKAQI
jgi:predicted transcriptional regulator